MTDRRETPSESDDVNHQPPTSNEGSDGSSVEIDSSDDGFAIGSYYRTSDEGSVSDAKDTATLKQADPSSIGQYAKLNFCNKFFQYSFNDEIASEEQSSRDYSEAFQPLKGLLSKDGNDFEEEVVNEIKEHFDKREDFEGGVGIPTDNKWKESIQWMRGNLENIAAQDHWRDGGDVWAIEQLRLGGNVGVINLNGASDYVIIWPVGNNTIRIRIIDMKAAFDESTDQQLQVAQYALLMDNFLEKNFAEGDMEWIIEGGIYFRESSITSKSPDDVPQFELRPRVTDVQRIMRDGGVMSDTDKLDEDEALYQLDEKCNGCSYKEACYTNSIENADISLLGITTGEQETLIQKGITTLYDLAGLAYPLDDPRPYEYGELTWTNPRDGKQKELLQNPTIGQKLPYLVQKAHALLAVINPDHVHAAKTKYAPWIQGSGDGLIPDDSEFVDTHEPGSLIRVNLQIEKDHRRDTIASAGAYITSRQHYENGGDPVEVSGVVENIGETVPEAQEEERAFIEPFFDDVFDGIEKIAEETGHEKTAPIHFYLYSSEELNALNETLERHDDSELLSSTHDLLSMRSGIDEREDEQQMVSVLENEVDERVALLTPSKGLIQTYPQFQPRDGKFMKYTDFIYENKDGDEVDLRSVFRKLFFDHEVPMERNDDGSVSLHFGRDTDYSAFDENYSSRARRGAQFPLEYVWAACGAYKEDLKEEYEDSADTLAELENIADENINPYIYHNAREDDSPKVSREDVEALSVRLARCVNHIERGLEYKNSNIEKSPLEIESLKSYSIGEASLPRACREFIESEYTAGRNETIADHSRPIRQRIRSGESTYFKVKEVVPTDESRDGYRVIGQLLYSGDPSFGSDKERKRVASACSVKDKSGNTAGSYMLASEFDVGGSNFHPVRNENPTYVGNGVVCEVTNIDLKGSDDFIVESDNDADENIIKENELAIEIEPRAFMRESKFGTWHRNWTVDIDGTETTPADEEDTVIFKPGKYFVLDPAYDSITALKEYKMMEVADDVPLAQTLVDLADGAKQCPSTNVFNEDAVSEFEQLLDEYAEYPPNSRQSEFLNTLDSQISLLQGPPGTGKTSGALASTMMSRVYSFQQDGFVFSGLIGGSSNTAVNETMDDIVALKQSMQNANATTAFDNLELIRLGKGEPSDEERIEGVNYLSLSDPEDASYVVNRLLHNSELGGSDQPLHHTIVFATPFRAGSLLHKVAKHYDSELNMEDYPRLNEPLFNAVGLDEASMMRVSQLILFGAGMHNDAQLFIAGDQRQMPPVLQHEWDSETRRTLIEYGPHLSALDWFRYVNGDEDIIERSHDNIALETSAEIPMTQLEQTYRCHQCVAGFLRKHLYDKYDEIDYRSEETDTALEPIEQSEGADTALSPEHPLVLIVHKEQASQKANPAEVMIAKTLSRGINESEAKQISDDAERLKALRELHGIVVPHNAQKGWLSRELDNESREVSPDVDTVERFQGGQKDTIIVSATASDRDFLKNEEDFILNPNRLNVAMSRMKKQLVVIASENVFDLMPKDTEKYERSLLWKGLYQETDVLNGDSEWTGTLADFVPDDTNLSQEEIDNGEFDVSEFGVDPDTELSVYGLDPDHFSDN